MPCLERVAKTDQNHCRCLSKDSAAILTEADATSDVAMPPIHAPSPSNSNTALLAS